MFLDHQPPKARLREWRTFRNLTGCELAAKAGIHWVTLYRIETDATKKPHIPTIRKLADALGITVADLYRNPLKGSQ